MPKPRSGGFVSWPYSVIQRGTVFRLNQRWSSVSKRGSDESVTFGHLTTWLGLALALNGYGWCAHASNFRRGFAFATSSANRPGEWSGRSPLALSLPRGEVSPI